nr:hypothetical protein 6 [Desulfobacterales bacterium]
MRWLAVRAGCGGHKQLNHMFGGEMTEKPRTINEIWSERDLCRRVDLHVTDSGRSRQLSHWIKGGLRFVEKSGRRYFFEQDIINYLYVRYETKYSK